MLAIYARCAYFLSQQALVLENINYICNLRIKRQLTSLIRYAQVFSFPISFLLAPRAPPPPPSFAKTDARKPWRFPQKDISPFGGGRFGAKRVMVDGGSHRPPPRVPPPHIFFSEIPKKFIPWVKKARPNNPEAFEMVRLTISSAKFILFFEKVWLFQIKAVPLHQQIPPRFSSQDQRTRVGRFF